MKTLFANLVAVSLLFGVSAFAETKTEVKTEKPEAASTAPTLDGKNFLGEMGEQGKLTGDPDHFVFSGGKFRSTACDQYGYSSAEYFTVDKGKSTSFQSVTENKNKDTMSWNGTVTGNQIEGTATRKPSGEGKPETYWFRGRLK